MAEHMQASTFVQRLGGSVLGVLGLAALLMACVGLYAVVASGVAERTQEIGIRLALGERADRIQRQVLTRSGRLALLGWVVGAAAALGLGQLFRDQLIGISPGNPVLLGLIGLTLLLAAAAASWIPARRAARQDPLLALRTES
jgi:ABC-type antimicrobial peptide transport system permease subunit